MSSTEKLNRKIESLQYQLFRVTDVLNQLTILLDINFMAQNCSQFDGSGFIRSRLSELQASLKEIQKEGTK